MLIEGIGGSEGGSCEVAGTRGGEVAMGSSGPPDGGVVSGKVVTESRDWSAGAGGRGTRGRGRGRGLGRAGGLGCSMCIEVSGATGDGAAALPISMAFVFGLGLDLDFGLALGWGSLILSSSSSSSDVSSITSSRIGAGGFVGLWRVFALSAMLLVMPSKSVYAPPIEAMEVSASMPFVVSRSTDVNREG